MCDSKCSFFMNALYQTEEASFLLVFAVIFLLGMEFGFHLMFFLYHMIFPFLIY